MTHVRTAAGAVIVALILISSSHNTAEAQEPQHWRVGTPIITYQTNLTAPINARQAREMAEGGWNLVWCPEKDMDLASRNGVRVMLYDDAVFTPQALLRPETLDDPAQLAKLDAFIARVKKNPSLYAYFIADEPSADRFPGLGRLVAHLRAQDPAHLAYIELLPTYASNEQLGVKGPTPAAYKEYVRQFVQIVKPELLGYDHYHFTTTGDGDAYYDDRGPSIGQKAYRAAHGGDGDEYFDNLGIIRQAALDAGIPFLTNIQGCTWATLVRCPNGDEMRWLTYTVLAYGAQGLEWYVWCDPTTYPRFKDKAGMIRPDGSTTPQYELAKSLNPQFVAMASQLQPLRSLGAYHVGKIYPGTQALPANAPFHLRFHTAEGDSPMPASGMLLGYFGKPDNSGKPCEPTHVLVVNLDYRNTVTTTVVGPGPLEAFDVAQQTWKRASGPETTLTLPPGGGTLVRTGG